MDAVLETVAATAQPTLIEMFDYAWDDDNVPGSPWLREPALDVARAARDTPELLIVAAANPVLPLPAIVDLLSHPDADVRRAAHRNPSLPLRMRTQPYFRLLHPDCPADETADMLRSANPSWRIVAARHPNLPDDARAQLVADVDEYVIDNPRLTQSEAGQLIDADLAFAHVWSSHPNADPDWLSGRIQLLLGREGKNGGAQVGAEVSDIARNPAVRPVDLELLYDHQGLSQDRPAVVANPGCPLDVLVSAFALCVDSYGGTTLRVAVCDVLTRRTPAADHLLPTAPTWLLPRFHQHLPSMLTFAAARATSPGHATAILKLAPSFRGRSLAELVDTAAALGAV